MTFEIDGDVKAILEFIHQSVARDQRVASALAVANLAPFLWGENPILTLALAPISLGDHSRQPFST